MSEKIKVLVVDDDALSCQILQDLLSQKGFVTFTASSCKDAYETADRENFHAALIDLNLPDGNGLDLLTMFKKKNPECVCFILTGFASMENAVKSLKSGADDFFVKPLVMEELLHRLTMALEKKELQQKLLQAESRYRLLVDQIQDGVVVLDAQAHFIHANPAVENMFGFSNEELLGKEISFLVPATDHPDYHKDFHGYLLDGSKEFVCASLQAQGRTHDGRLVPVEISIGELQDSGRETFICVIRDISQRKAAEDRLLRQHEELDALFKQVEVAKREWEQTMDCIGDMVLLVDTRGRIKRFNKAFVAFLGLAPGEVLGTNWLEIMGQHDMAPLFPDDGADQIEHYHEKTGRWFVFSRFSYKTRDSEEIAGQVIAIHDTTLLKKASQELEEMNDAINLQHLELQKTMGALEKAYEELKMTQSQILQQEKMASIGQLAAGVAHEINNPTGFIISNLGSMGKYLDKVKAFLDDLKQVAAEAPASVHGQFDQILKKHKIDFVLEDAPDLIAESIDGAERVKTIVQNLKNFSRVDQAENTMADINECIDSTINIVWNELKYKTTLHKEYGDIPRTKCFPQQLNQVFMNLLVNGAQAIPEKGEITVRTWQENGYICASFTDTGKGIKPEHLNRLFEPFFTTKEVGKGTGLGLSIAYDIVTKKHNGTLSVVSEVGKGATFTVKIPILEQGDD